MKRLARSEVAGVLADIVKKQGRVCAICKQPFTRWDVPVLDHCHDTGFIRGAVHNSCNGTEGRIKKVAQRGHKGVSSVDYVIGLGKYLEMRRDNPIPILHPEHKTPDEKRLERNAKARAKRKANK